MDWYVVDKNYFEYLREFDSQIGYIEYGSRAKLHLGVILNVGNFFYYVPISSPKPKHERMKNSLDFHKIQDESGFYAVLNLNNMIPAPENCVQQVKYDQIENFRQFDSELEKTNYIYLLQKEKRIIDVLEDTLKFKAQKLYSKCVRYPHSNLAARCCNFRLLEEKLLLWRNQNSL